MIIDKIARLDPVVTTNKTLYQNDKDDIHLGQRLHEAGYQHNAAGNYDEFIFLAEGCVTFTDRKGNEKIFRAGDSFILPKGVAYSRRQDIKTAEIYVSYTDVESVSTVDHIIALNPDSETTEINIADTSQFLGNIPRHYKNTFYNDSKGRFLIAKWESDPFERDVAPFNRYELMIFLQGLVNLSDGADICIDFKPGDLAFVPHQAPYKWTSEDYLGKFYCIVMPK